MQLPQTLTPSAAILVSWLAAVAACTPGGEPAVGDSFPDAEELMAADRAFALDSAERGAEAWSEVWAESGMLYGDGEAPLIGPVAAARGVTEVVDDLRWEPTGSAMLWPGAVGYTVGFWWMAPETSGGGENRQRYLTVWQRIDNEWKVALDLSLPENDDDEAARDFDFWLGDWTLEQRIWSGDGDQFESYTARNQVRAIEGDGALVENLEGDVRFFWLGMQEPAHMRGVSVRVYDSDAGVWRIFWMDSLNPKFGPPFTGSFSGSIGNFLLTERPDGIPPGRIRFEPRSDGMVDWQLAIRTADGESWQPLWFIKFRRGEGGKGSGT
jgi:hypothetical protein